MLFLIISKYLIIIILEAWFWSSEKQQILRKDLEGLTPRTL